MWQSHFVSSETNDARYVRRACTARDRLPGNKISSLQSRHLPYAPQSILIKRSFSSRRMHIAARIGLRPSFSPSPVGVTALFEDKYLETVRQIVRVYRTETRCQTRYEAVCLSVHGEGPILIGRRRRCLPVPLPNRRS